MPCIPPQHFCVSHHPSLGHCIEVLPFNIYHDNYCKPNTGSFSFPGIEVASSPKETVPVPGLALHSTISKTINRQDRKSDAGTAIWLFSYCTEYLGQVGESRWLTKSFEKILLVVCPNHLLQKIRSDSSYGCLGNVT